MPIKAVQQFMLGTVLSNEQQAKETLAAMKAAGYDGIELCGFMIHPIGFMVRLLTKAAGMPVGKGGNLDWHALVKEAELQVVSLHTDLGSLERDAKAVADEAKSFGTKYVVITGMYRFDYGDEATMHGLAARLNKAGEALKGEGVEKYLTAEAVDAAAKILGSEKDAVTVSEIKEIKVSGYKTHMGKITVKVPMAALPESGTTVAVIIRIKTPNGNIVNLPLAGVVVEETVVVNGVARKVRKVQLELDATTMTNLQAGKAYIAAVTRK